MTGAVRSCTRYWLKLSRPLLSMDLKVSPAAEDTSEAKAPLLDFEAVERRFRRLLECLGGVAHRFGALGEDAEEEHGQEEAMRHGFSNAYDGMPTTGRGSPAARGGGDDATLSHVPGESPTGPRGPRPA